MHRLSLGDILSTEIYSRLIFLYQQVKIIMEQCWAAEPKQRPSFRSLIEKFEGMHRPHGGKFSLAHIC